jgi:hypothetical protein
LFHGRRRRTLRAERLHLEQLLADHSALARAVPQTQTQLQEALASLDAASDVAASAARAAQAATAREQDARARRVEHLVAKPGLVEMVFTVGKAVRRWHAEDEPLSAEIADAQARVRQTEEAQALATEALAQAQAEVTAAERAVVDSSRRLVVADRTLREAAAAWGDAFPDEAWWNDPRRRELSGPWLDEAWNTARSRVLLAALDLHAAFITATASILARNLDTARRILQGQAPRDLAEPVARAAWQSLFLVIPVVSTTFASVPRLFHHVSAEALGWLFIDEAGQARPQSAVGAIWRSRRVVAVGDPMQLEPVITVLNTTQQALRRHYQVAPTWAPSSTCVQSLADRLTSLGTWLPGADQGADRVWVGAPLRVHRRCDEPMFSLVNQLVYDQLMVHATAPRSSPLDVVPTRWVDVTGPSGGGNWVPLEGEAVNQILGYLLRQRGLSPDQILRSAVPGGRGGFEEQLAGPPWRPGQHRPPDPGAGARRRRSRSR